MEKTLKNWKVTFKNENGVIRTDTFYDWTAGTARRSFEACYRHGNYEILSIEEENDWFETLKAEAEYAQGSYSTELLYQTYGKATMARELGVISPEQFMELNAMTVVFMNTDKEYMRRKVAEFLGKDVD